MKNKKQDWREELKDTFFIDQSDNTWQNLSCTEIGELINFIENLLQETYRKGLRDIFILSTEKHWSDVTDDDINKLIDTFSSEENS